MPIQFTCPHCGTETNVADEFAGQSGPCSQCGKTVTIPQAGPPAETPTGYALPPQRSSGMPLVAVLAIVGLGVLFCGGILVALLLPATQAAREAARRAACTNNLKQIGLAMHNYHDTYRCFPPAYIPDENGRPMHSWRVLILPFMEQQALYDQYDFDEPWDGPNNSRLHDMIGNDYFSCPSDVSVDGMETNYVMIIGPGTISDGPTPSSIQQIADGTSNTIMIVEVANSGIDWMEPRDLDVDEIDFEIGSPVGPGIGSNHPGRANVLFADGAVHSINDSIDPEAIKGMSTIAGGEAVSPYEMQY